MSVELIALSCCRSVLELVNSVAVYSEPEGQRRDKVGPTNRALLVFLTGNRPSGLALQSLHIPESNLQSQAGFTRSSSAG